MGAIDTPVSPAWRLRRAQPRKGDYRWTWLGNVRYPAETMQDLSDAEWIGLLIERYGDRICFYEPQAGGNPRRTAAEWRDRGRFGVYLKG